MKLCVLIYIVVLCSVFLYIVFSPNKEHFTVDRRDYRLCPYVTNRERSLIPNAIVLVVQGYNYTEVPRLFYNDKYIRPVQYHWDSDALSYYFTLSTDDICGGRWTLETSENVKPLITEGYSQKLIGVIPTFTSTRYIWQIVC